MIDALNILCGVAAGTLILPLGVFSLTVLASFLPRRHLRIGGTRPPVAVLIPAHDEAEGIGRTIDAVAAQLLPGDRLLVVADNCRDATAAVTSSRGVEVVERSDGVRRGKGYALDFGVRHLERTGFRAPGVLIIIDADVSPAPQAIASLAEQVDRTARPAQAVYLLDAPAKPGTRDLVSRFAFKVRNLVRPLGLARLDGPCPLFGCGMAFPWEVIRKAPLATGDLVEDLTLGLDLAATGHAARLCETSRFVGVLPCDAQAARTQRTRWDRGHLRAIRTRIPGLLLRGLCDALRGRPSLFVLALDAAVPPLTLLLAMTAATLVVLWGIAYGVPGAWDWPPVSLSAATALLLVCLVIAWGAYGRDTHDVRSVTGVPEYLLNRLPGYRSILLRTRTSWIRTPRDHEPLRYDESPVRSNVSTGVAREGVSPMK